jgi:hypothetical protein
MNLKFFQKLEKFISYTIKLGGRSRNFLECGRDLPTGLSLVALAKWEALAKEGATAFLSTCVACRT